MGKMNWDIKCLPENTPLTVCSRFFGWNMDFSLKIFGLVWIFAYLISTYWSLSSSFCCWISQCLSVMAKQLQSSVLFLTGTHIVQFFQIVKKRSDEEHMKTISSIKKKDCLSALLALTCNNKCWFQATGDLAKTGCAFIRSSVFFVSMLASVHFWEHTANVQKTSPPFWKRPNASLRVAHTGRILNCA